MKKRLKENKNDFLSFPYKCYLDSEEYKNRKADSIDITDERIKYYRALHKSFFPDDFSHLNLGVRYFPLIPLRLMVGIYEDEADLDAVVPFFLNPSKDNAPQESYAESLPFEFILGEIECFYQVYQSRAFRCDQPYPIQIKALQIDFEGYLHSLERIANEETLDALYDAQRYTAPLFDALATRTIGKGHEIAFRENMACLRACVERIVKALYKLEALCFTKIKTPKPVNKDMIWYGFGDRDRKMLQETRDAACYGKMPSDKRRAGDVRHNQVVFGADLYRPSSKFAKGFSFRKAAAAAINDPQFKNSYGAYKMSEVSSLARAIARECKAQKPKS